MVRVLLLTGLMVLQVCCKTTSYKKTLARKAQTDTPKMVFFTFDIRRTDSSTGSQIMLTNTVVADGSFKNSVENPGSHSLVLLQTDSKGNVLHTTRISHPLYKEIEYTDDRDAFTHQCVVLEKAEFFIRTEFHALARKLTIQEIVNQKEINTCSIDL